MTFDNGSDLSENGWARYDSADFARPDASLDLQSCLNQLRDFFMTLPADFYEPKSNRYRRHARAVYLPWSRHLSWLPNIATPDRGEVVDYDMQGYNAEFSGVARQFPAIPGKIQENPLVRRIVEVDLNNTMWLGGFPTTPLNVGVGCVMLAAEEEDDEALSTPNCLHQDGGSESFTFIHLVERTNVIGGVNYIAPPRCVGLLPSEISPDLVHSEFSLDEPLDSFAVHNSRVSHYVSPVHRGNQLGGGRRCVLLVAVSPLTKKL